MFRTSDAVYQSVLMSMTVRTNACCDTLSEKKNQRQKDSFSSELPRGSQLLIKANHSVQ